jgi:hypothetical protein
VKIGEKLQIKVLGQIQSRANKKEFEIKGKLQCAQRGIDFTCHIWNMREVLVKCREK